ncbi:hypothetical protein BGZ60DRAFT_414066 [Tricladium varicosporioides]|nr:hypothetical protein BGZ60DRAFT_414066 [Hymenoscyphus varicosporioides]
MPAKLYYPRHKFQPLFEWKQQNLQNGLCTRHILHLSRHIVDVPLRRLPENIPMPSQPHLKRLYSATLYIRCLASVICLAALISAILFSVLERETSIFLYCVSLWGLCLNGIDIQCLLSRRYRFPAGILISLDIIEICISTASIIVLLIYHYGFSTMARKSSKASPLVHAQMWIAIALASVHAILVMAGYIDCCLWARMRRNRERETINLN